MILDNIKKFCKEKNIPVYKLACDLGLPSVAIYKMKTHSPSVYRAKQIADYLGVTVDELLKDE